MIETLLSSKTRMKLLMKFFLNSNNSSYLRNLEEEFGESTNGIRIELNRFEKAGFLESRLEGNKKMFKVNVGHPLFKDLNSILMKVEAAMRSVQQSHKLWHDPSFVTVDKADPVLSMFELSFLYWSSKDEVGVLASASGL